VVGKFLEKYPEVPGWRKMGDWYRQLKNSMRAVGNVSSSGGKRQRATGKTSRTLLSVKITGTAR